MSKPGENGLLPFGIIFKPYRGRSYFGGEFDFEIIFLDSNGHDLDLLRQIKRMPKGNPICLHDACRLVQREAAKQIREGNNDPKVVGSSNWLTGNGIQWLIENGYQIKTDISDYSIVFLSSYKFH